MHPLIKQILDQFEEAFMRSPDFRIEELAFDDAQYESLKAADKKKLMRELILLEACLRYEAGHQLVKNEYEVRFPDCLDDIDDAFRKNDDRRRQEKSDWLMEVTQAFGEEGFIVSNDGLKDLPNDLGKYKNIERVGEGGFGVVCKAWDSDANEFRALKFPTKTSDREGNFLADVKKETEKSVGLDHPNVVKTYGMEVIGPFAFVVQEFVEGSDLKTWMQGSHSIREKVEMVKKIADGLHYAHSVPHEITHCDIKPANILVDQAGNPKIADFGLAFREKNRLGLPALIVGTPAYLAPQIAEGYIRQADGRVDIFSLGVIFYEMLANVPERNYHRPFGNAESSREELIREILTKDPRSIRTINPEVDKQLDQICLRCLAKKTLDRHQVAGDLSDELQAWLEKEELKPEKEVASANAIKITPRGLRSFQEDDKDFFTDLLPGVRDRHDVPLSLSFWLKHVVEPVRADERIPNGFLFGPSGSGKSSFVRAGLVPEIKKEVKRRNTQPVKTIYVESTRDDTEVRILNSLRQSYPTVPNDKSIPEVFAGLSNGNWRNSGNEKILLVIDQFEQWISRDEPFEDSQLVKALKHCDGQNLQCLMLVRDDFFLSTLRFADTLDINLQEDENFKNIDLFDEVHAKKVLIKLGQAYDKLPADELITPEHHEFVDKTIEQLARNHFVVCVRLTLFVEMFKHRQWTVEELESVGGIAGVGEQFLDFTFGEETTSPEFRGRRKTVQAILEELLPEPGRNIRGIMKTREQLLAAAEYEGKEKQFDQILQRLHRNLTLITRTDPDASGDTSIDEDTTQSGQEYYQLTHDYLVPSIRNWLNTELRNTRRGRALIRLRELAAQVVPGQKPKYLPGNLEWLYWQCSIRDRIKSENEKRVNSSAFQRFVKLTTTFAIAIIVMAAVGLWIQKRTRINGLVADLVGHEIELVPEIVGNLHGYKDSARSALASRLRDEPPDSTAQFRLKLGLIPFGSGDADTQLNELIKPEFGPTDIRAIGKLLSDYSFLKVDDAKQVVADSEVDPKSRLRCICLLNVVLGDSWKVNEHALMALESLSNEPIETIDQWIELLGINGPDYVDELEVLLNDVKEREQLRALIFAKAFFRFADTKSRNRIFVELIQTGNDSQFDAILSTIEKSGTEDELANLLAVEYENNNNDENIENQTNLLAALTRLGKTKLLESAIENGKNIQQRLLVDKFNPMLIRTRSVVAGLFDNNQPKVKRFTWAVLAEHSFRFSDFLLQKRIVQAAEDLVQYSNDPVVYANSELVLRRQNQRERLNLLRKSRKQNAAQNREQKVRINFLNTPMVTLANGDGTKVEVAMYETTNSEWIQFCDDNGITKKEFLAPNNDLPYRIFWFGNVLKYCNWLSAKENLDPCYPDTITIQNIRSIRADTTKSGYRLPTLTEWKMLSAMDASGYSPRIKLKCFDRFANIFENSKGQVGPGGQRLPNENGLFDLVGNLHEVIENHDKNVDDVHFKSGGSSRSQSDFAFGVPRYFDPLNVGASTLDGFRICRSIKQ